MPGILYLILLLLGGNIRFFASLRMTNHFNVFVIG